MGEPWVFEDRRVRRAASAREVEVWKKRSLSVVMDMAVGASVCGTAVRIMCCIYTT